MTSADLGSVTVWLTILMSFEPGPLSVLWGQPIAGTPIVAAKDGTIAFATNARVPIMDKETRCGVRSSADTTRRFTAPLPLDTCGAPIANIAEADPLNPSPPAANPLFGWPADLTFAGLSGLCQNDVENPAPAQGRSPQGSLPPPNHEDKDQPAPDQPPENKHIFGVLPNYRMAEGSAPFQPITTRQKFIIATKDSFDYPVFLTTAFFAGLSQLEGSDNNLYRPGVRGFAHRYGFGYADQVISNFFPEAIVPALFHKDPRYFRKGEGSKKSRLVYAIDRIFVSKSDSGATTFNSPEILGNGFAA